MDLSISEIRKIINTIEDNFITDLSIFAHTTLKSRLLYTMKVFEYNNADELMVKINKNIIKKNDFLFHFSPPYTEMFRDPSMWRKLKTDLVSKIKDYKFFKIFLPACSTGDEYYTLLVILNELNIIDNVKITVSSWSNKTIEFIKEVKILPKKIEIHKANFKRYEGKDGLDKYFENNKLKTLQRNTNFVKINLFNDKLPTNQDMVIFRNKIIYLKEEAQNIIVDNLFDSLKIGGKFIVGIKENIYLNKSVKDKFSEQSNTERIYKKIINEI